MGVVKSDLNKAFRLENLSKSLVGGACVNGTLEVVVIAAGWSGEAWSICCLKIKFKN